MRALALHKVASVHNMAASNVTTVIAAPDAFYLNYGGTEFASLQTTTATDDHRAHDPVSRQLNQTTVDDFMRAHALQAAYYVAIDAEG